MPIDAINRLEQYTPGGEDTGVASWKREGAIALYWLLAFGLAVGFRLPELSGCRVPQTLASIWCPALLIATLAFSQWLYSQVAISEDRPFNWIGTPIFVIGNAIGETLAFLVVFSAGAWVGKVLGNALGVTGLPFDLLKFGLGFLVFLFYGGGIHGLFWMRIFPPHFREDERARKIRKFRLWSESALSLSWCLTFFVFHDLWSVVVFHAIVDLVLMIRVRPGVFRFASAHSAQP